MRGSLHSYSRGGSILAALLVVAILGVAAVELDAISHRGDAAAQSAATAAATPDPKSAPAQSDAPKPITGSCQIGQDYVVKMEDANGTKVPKIYVADLNDSTKAAATIAAGQRCSAIPGAPLDGTGNERWCQSSENAAQTAKRDPTKKDWQCKVRVCKDITQKVVVDGKTEDKTVEKCYLAPETMPVGKTLDAGASLKDVDVDVAKQAADPNLKPEEQEAAKAFVSSGNLTNSNDILKAWNAEKQETDKNIALQNAVIEKSKVDVQAALIAYQSCTSSPVLAPEADNCAGREQQLQDANQKLAQEQARLEELKAQSARLAELPKTLQPPTSPEPPQESEPYNCPGGPNCPGGAWDPSSQKTTTIKTPSLNVPPPPSTNCGVWCRLLNNVNQPDQRAQLYAACQAGNNQACQAYINGGAYSAYGAYPSGAQGSCGAGGRPTNLIGTILSLFVKSGSNCPGGTNANGVPIPSCSITASARNVAAGEPVQLSWQSQNAFSAILSNGGPVPVQGSMSVTPQTTTTYTLSLGGYRDNRTGQQVRGQCAVQVVVGADGDGTAGGGTSGAPKAQISCQPQVADVGMSVAIAYACQNASTSGGTGFPTDNKMSGSAAPVVAAPSLGSESVIYGLTCASQGRTDTAQCTVAINQPSIVLIANPQDIASGEEASLGWISSGTDACTIASPDLPDFSTQNAGNTSSSGVAKSPALAQDTRFVLTCTTKAGGTKTAETTVRVAD